MFNAFVQLLLIYYNSNLYVSNQRISISHYYIQNPLLSELLFKKKSHIWDIGKERLNDLFSHHQCEFVWFVLFYLDKKICQTLFTLKTQSAELLSFWQDFFFAQMVSRIIQKKIQPFLKPKSCKKLLPISKIPIITMWRNFFCMFFSLLLNYQLFCCLFILYERPVFHTW